MELLAESTIITTLEVSQWETRNIKCGTQTYK